MSEREADEVAIVENVGTRMTEKRNTITLGDDFTWEIASELVNTVSKRITQLLDPLAHVCNCTW